MIVACGGDRHNIASLSIVASNARDVFGAKQAVDLIRIEVANHGFEPPPVFR